MKPVPVEPDTPRPAVEPTDPQIISEIKPDETYVLESPVKLFAMTSPAGVLDVSGTEGPVKTRAVFSDGNGKQEIRTYTAPWVYFVTAIGKGKAELILVPEGVKLRSAVDRIPSSLAHYLPESSSGSGKPE